MMRPTRDGVKPPMRVPVICVALLAALTLVLGLGGPASAATINVTNTNNLGTGSLRAAISQANQLFGSDVIRIQATGTIQLQSRLPDLETDLAIHGPGAPRLIVDGQALGQRVPFTIPAGAVVDLRGISIEHGPGGIDNGGTLTVEQSILSELGTHPRTTHLGKIRNPSPTLHPKKGTEQKHEGSSGEGPK